MKWGWEDFVPANPDLADIWGDMDLSFENDYFVFSWVPNFQIQGPDFQKSGLGTWIWKFGTQNISKIKVAQIHIHLAKNDGNVWVGRKNKTASPMSCNFRDQTTQKMTKSPGGPMGTIHQDLS